MSACFDTILACLKEKERLMEQLILNLDGERDYIVAMDTAGMESMRTGKMEIIQNLERCKAAFKKVMMEASAELRLESNAKLSDILKAAPSPQGDNLAAMQRRLLELNDVLNRSNRFNRDLLYGSLGMINRSIAFFNNCFGKESTYGVGGLVVSGIPGGRLVSGAI